VVSQCSEIVSLSYLLHITNETLYHCLRKSLESLAISELLVAHSTFPLPHIFG